MFSVEASGLLLNVGLHVKSLLQLKIWHNKVWNFRWVSDHSRFSSAAMFVVPPCACCDARVSPAGQPYNQLAILASSKGDHLTTIFYYCRSIAVKFPFPAASTNLQKALSKALER